MTLASAVKRNPVGRVFWELFNWYPSHLSPSDRTLLLKLDRSILIFASLSFFCKYLDQSNITVSPLPPPIPTGSASLAERVRGPFYLGLTPATPVASLSARPVSTERVRVWDEGGCRARRERPQLPQRRLLSAYPSYQSPVTVCSSADGLPATPALSVTAYVVGQIPMVMLQSRPSLAPYFLPSLEVIWAILTFAQSRVSRPWHLYLIRALVGFAEAPSFGGTHLVLGSWYRPEELFKRAGMWFMGNSLGSMFSGYLQAAAYKNLNGVRGMAGWQWVSKRLERH